jgi:hypothetical protein
MSGSMKHQPDRRACLLRSKGPNETGPYSTEWQYHLNRFIKQCEAGR